MEWRCLMCSEIFECSGSDIEDDEELRCPACDSLSVELYSSGII